MIKDYFNWCWYIVYGKFKNKWDGPILVGIKFSLSCFYLVPVLLASPFLFPTYALGRVLSQR